MNKSTSLPLTVLVIFTLLTTLALSATQAQPAPPPPTCPEGEVFVPEQNACVPADQVPTQVPTAVVEPTSLPQGNLASFTLYHLACDSDFDPNGVRDAGGLGPANGCLTFGKPPFTYTISANGITVTTVTLDATERDFARLDVPGPIPAGTLTIAVAPVAGYTTEFISCGLEIGEAGTDVIEPAVAGGTATLSTLPDQKVECWVYNVNRQPVNQDQGQGEDEVVGSGDLVNPGTGDDPGMTVDTTGTTGATITIAAYLCPAGVTATDDLIAACTQRAGGLAFSLLTASETLETQTSDAEGDIFYSGLPVDQTSEYGIAVELPSGYGEPIVICYVADPIGNVFEGQRDVVFGNQVRLQLGDGFSAECAWYNVPAQGPDNGPNVFIQARKCGAGITIAPPMTVFEAEQLCGVVYQNKEFQVQLDGQVLATSQTNDDPLSSGQAFFTRLPAPNGGGVYGITTTLAQGERLLGVFCDQDFGADRFVTVTTNIVDGNRIDHELLEGWTLRCSWFIDISTSPVGTQVMDPPGQDAAPGETGDEPAPDVTDPAETLTGPQVGQEPPAAATAEGEGGAEPSWQPGITVQVRRCPADVAGLEPDADLTADCTEPAAGIPFEILVDSASTGTLVTDANGEFVIPSELGPGQYLFRHRPAPDQLEVRTVCSSVYANGSTATGRSQAVGPEMSELYLTYDGASSIVCTFHVVMDSAAPEGEASPEGEAPPAGGLAEGERDSGSEVAAPHTLTIQFWTCSAGADPAADQAALLQACAPDFGERSFMLTLDNVATGETVTGAAMWTFTEPVAEADIGAGLASSAWCSATWSGGSEDASDVGDTVSLEGGALTVTVSQPATTVSCDWFLFPD